MLIKYLKNELLIFKFIFFGVFYIKFLKKQINNELKHF